MASKARDFVARFLSDTDKFDTDKPQDELEDLARVSDTTSKRMDSSFDRVRRSSSDNLDKIGTEGTGKAAEAGREIGTELAANLGESIASGQANIGDLVAGTLGGLVAIPGLGIAAAGIGIAGLFVKGMLDGVAKSKQALSEATQRVVDSIDVDLTTFATKFDTSKFLTDSIAALTEGGLTEDIDKFKQLAKDTVGEDTLTRILAGTADDEVRNQLRFLIEEGHRIGADQGRMQTDAGRAAEETLRLLDKQVEAVDKGTDAVETQIRAQQRLNGYIETSIGLLTAAQAAAVTAHGANFINLPTDDR